MDKIDQRSTAISVQSDLDLHSPQKLFVSSTVEKELKCLFLTQYQMTKLETFN